MANENAKGDILLSERERLLVLSSMAAGIELAVKAANRRDTTVEEVHSIQEFLSTQLHDSKAWDFLIKPEDLNAVQDEVNAFLAGIFRRQEEHEAKHDYENRN